MADYLDFNPPFGSRCEGCKLVASAIEGDGYHVLTCFPPEAAGGNAVLRDTLVTIAGKVEKSYEGLCQVVEASQPNVIFLEAAH